MTSKTHRRHPWRWVFGILGAIIVAAVVGVLVWSQVGVMGAEPEPLAAVRADERIAISDDSAGIVLAPASGTSATGLVFIPGAKVDPWAYASILSGLVTDDELTVVITKPWLNLAFFDPRGLSTFTALAPGVDRWLVGGHSLGGVRACQLAPDAAGLVLFGSYCANDLSGSSLPTLSLAGSEDGLSTPQKIADARHNLPGDAVIVTIPGASHASFGDYGAQPGDGTPTARDADVAAVVVRQVGDLVGTLG
ncbi:alpha/beta hydrolase [Microbacterium sp. B24]|uniref:alpha/beta hydrolase n=1 Tax=Microbacterium sp. B24 TaxID=95616 RepID=UPI00041B57C3|nr:alpha/beta hydrolase [Microbacterium sp. B24]